MSRLMLHFVSALIIIVITGFISPIPTHAETKQLPESAGSPYDLINAVNSLRASYGLAPYAISSILMTTAQNQADYMAATGSVSHTGAGGSSVTDRLLSAGYPLAGDLSLGGFRSENITAGSEEMSAQAAVDQWTGDAPHLNTMISPNLTEIGAGVTVNGGRVYYVIDAARPTNNGVPQDLGTSSAAGSPVPAGGGVIIPVVVSTPNADGNLLHEVKAGQTLWQIAISYETKIDEIKRLNNLFDNDIYPGMKLLVKQGVALTPTATLVIAIIRPTSTPTNIPTFTATIPSVTLTSHPSNTSGASSPTGIMGVVMGILAAAILAGGVVAWLGNKKK